MKLDRTSIIGIAVCVVLYIGYEQFLNSKYPERYNIKETQTSLLEENKKEVSTLTKINKQNLAFENQAQIKENKSANNNVEILSQEELTLENEKIRYTLDQYTGGFRDIQLKDYLDDEKAKPVSLVDETLFLVGTSTKNFAYPKSPYKGTRLSSDTVKLERREGPWLIEQIIRLDPKSPYGAELEFNWTNLDKSPRNLTSSVYVANKIKFKKAKSTGFLPGMPTNKQALASLINGSSEWNDIEDYCSKNNNKPLLVNHNASIGFDGFDSHYFLKAFIPQAKQSNLVVSKLAYNPGVSCSLSAKHELEQGMINPGEKAHFKFKAWFGPKAQSLMTDYSPELKDAVDLGMFSQISHVFLKILQFLYDMLGNWGLAIIVFTLLLKTLLYPLVKSSSVSMHKMKALQPAMNEIKEKYKKDPQRQQQETMKFMSKHKVNPLKGCLPILPQFPLFIACWRTLSSSVELRHAPFFGWISDLSAQDPYYITPLLLGGCMFLQQKLTPTTGMDKTQEKMLLFMPLMFSLFMLTLPSGMVLYSLTNSVISIAQQQWLNRKLQAK